MSKYNPEDTTAHAEIGRLRIKITNDENDGVTEVVTPGIGSEYIGLSGTDRKLLAYLGRNLGKGVSMHSCAQHTVGNGSNVSFTAVIIRKVNGKLQEATDGEICIVTNADEKYLLAEM